MDGLDRRKRLLAMLAGIKNQIEKGHYLNVHFRAFELANDAWKEHVLANARIGSEAVRSPGGAVLDESRDDN